MDLEQEMQTLLHEESFLDSLIEKLSGLSDYNNLSKCSADAQKLLEILKAVTEPVYAKMRSKIPPLAGFDLSPFILLLVLLSLKKIFELQ